MEWIKKIQEAIDYVEEGLMTDLDYETIPDRVYMSSYHFHRTFSLLMGMSLTDYIRRRRMSLAGQEVVATDKKVIDLAYDYFFASPESFTKAFTRFHGVTPSLCRKLNHPIKTFNRMYIALQVKGGLGMEYKIVTQEAFKVLALVRDFDNKIINEEGNTDIGDFWKETISRGGLKDLISHSQGNFTLGLCDPVSDQSKTFEYGIGVKVAEDFLAPEGYVLRDFRAGDYAVFECRGQDGACIGQVWERIFSEFLVHSPYDLVHGPDFEIYYEHGDPQVFCEIWIPVKIK